MWTDVWSLSLQYISFFVRNMSVKMSSCKFFNRFHFLISPLALLKIHYRTWKVFVEEIMIFIGKKKVLSANLFLCKLNKTLSFCSLQIFISFSNSSTWNFLTLERFKCCCKMYWTLKVCELEDALYHSYLRRLAVICVARSVFVYCRSDVPRR